MKRKRIYYSLITLSYLFINGDAKSQALKAFVEEYPKNNIQLSYESFPAYMNRFNLVYKRNVKKYNLYLGFFKSSGYIANTNNLYVDERDSLVISGYPRYITAPDEKGDFIGHYITGSYNSGYGLKFGVELTPKYFGKRISWFGGLGIILEKYTSTYFEEISNYSIDTTTDGNFDIKTYFKGQINQQYVTEYHVVAGVQNFWGLRYDLFKRFSLFGSVNLQASINKLASESIDRDNSNYSLEFSHIAPFGVSLYTFDLLLGGEVGLSYSF